MECPANTVKTRLFHARAKLQKLLPHLASPSLRAGAARENHTS
jgi:DNA-directed RNA polymerase specialized sigma24 family protein